jgi:hypothetical protein
MLEKLATHDVETVPTLFALADKCARAAEGRAWHSAPQTGAVQSGGSGAVPQDRKKKKKDRDYQKPRSTALVVAAATEGQGDRRGVTAAHAQCTPTVATAPWSVTRSLTSRNASVSGTSSFPKAAPHLAADLAKKRWTMARWPRLSGISGISRPKGT